jgi:hypothetical protein
LFLIIAYAAGGELCAITYGLSPRIYYRNVLTTVAKIVISIALLAATIILAIMESTNRLIGSAVVVVFILFLISVIVIFIGNSPLRVVRYQDGTFWIKGFSKEYLDNLEL